MVLKLGDPRGVVLPGLGSLMRAVKSPEAKRAMIFSSRLIGCIK